MSVGGGGTGRASKARESRRRRLGRGSVGRGVSVTPVRSGEGLCPLPRKLFEFLYQNGELSCILSIAISYRLAARFALIGSTCGIEFCEIVSICSYFQMFIYSSHTES